MLLVTSLSLHRLQQKGKALFTSPGRAVETERSTRGLPVTMELVNRNFKQQAKEGERLTVYCTDGCITEYARATLVSNFQYIDDFLTEFPEGSLTLPYSEEVVREALQGLLDGGVLSECLECVHYLNPKDNTYYLRYDLGGLSESTIQQLSDQLTLEERKRVLEARTYNILDYPLPCQGLGIDITIVDAELMYGILSVEEVMKKYPSFIVAASINSKAGREGQYLLNSTFDDDSGTLNLRSPMIGEIRRRIVSLLREHGRTWKEVGRLLAMLGIQDERLENMDPVLAPYQLQPDTTFNRTLLNNMDTVTDIALKIVATGRMTYEEAIDVLVSKTPKDGQAY